MKIVVIGAGYVGMSLAVLLAQKNDVKILEILHQKVSLINEKISPIKDKEIELYLSTKRLNLVATSDENVIKDAELIIIAVPTDYDYKKQYFNTTILDKTLNTIETLNDKATVVIKSTVPIGYTEKASSLYKLPHLLFSPDFLRESKALFDNLHPSRIIVGVPFNNDLEFDTAKEFASLLKENSLDDNTDVLIMGSTEAESIKLFSNTYLAMRVAFFNELDTFTIMKNLDSKQIIKGVCLDPRIGDFYNNPSFGYAGYCLPKDTKQLLANYEGIPQEMISSIINANKVRKDFIANEILKKNPKLVGIYRLNMKSGSDNFRSSSIQDIITILIDNKIDVLIYEPTLNSSSFSNIKVENNLDIFKTSCDLIVANRFDDVLLDVKSKVFTRDIFLRD